jgi:hypothetical protein
MTNHDQDTVLRATADVRRILRDPTPVLRLAPWIGSLPKWKGVNLCAQLVEWTAAEYCGSLTDVRRSRAQWDCAMKTVLVYINNSKEVGDVGHLKVFANEEAAEKWFSEKIPRAWRLCMT